MKLRNKQTGEVVELLAKPSFVKRNEDFLQSEVNTFNSLAELNAEWEDVPEEPIRHWFISGTRIYEENGYSDEGIASLESVGNHFKSKEEAEKAVEKLKAWKRLKDKGFKFDGHDDRDRGQLGDIVIYAEMPTFEYDDDSTRDDLDLLFGGKE